MKTVFLDTSYKTMTIACVEHKQVVAFYHEEAFKRQSELAMSVLDESIKEAGWVPREIDEIVIASGPGSYTGVRIAMTIAKTLAAISDIRVKTITSLEIFVESPDKTLVLFDARSERAYVGMFENRKYIQGPLVCTVDQIKELIESETFIVKGDGHLLGKTDSFTLNKQEVITLVENAKLVEDVDHLKPLYLKEMSAY